ncbi:hypothetical protein OG500_19035 [Kitasatospora sp. NBC_01250]|uniref:hypothetical protein n=1 Tax=Kitasatospora sp. NBC_01250 TaxID=2903571 RepID=UPI002E359D33|nr:hypothetical protein [Kitasatospora sp. NBC_01250]
MAVAAREPMEMVSAAAAPGTLLPDESQVGAVTLLGTHAVVAYRRDVQECQRRHEARTGVLGRSDVLDLLMSLPVNAPVPVASLTEAERRTLKAVPRGAVVRSSGMVTRQVIQPLRVDLAVVPGRGWETAMEKAERFTPFCTRAVLVEGALRRKDDAVMQADFYGIGLLVAVGDEVDVLVPPRPFVRRRHSAAAWRFVEEVHRQLG